MQKQCFVLIRKTLIILLIGIFILSGCRQNEITTASDSVSTEKFENSVSEAIDIKTSETEDRNDGLQKPPKVPVNTKAENIYYHSKDGIELSRALHRSTADENNIFLTHGELDLYIMPIGTDEHIPANIHNPEGMLVLHVTTDTMGRIHLLMVDYDNREYFIWQLNENYQTENEIDISAFFEHKNRIPLWFMIDKDDIYYLQWPFDRSGIIVDSEGTLKHKTTKESLGTKWIYEAAVGKDGCIYLIHGNPDEKIEIGKLDVENGIIENVNPALYFPGDEIFMTMSGGTDTNLLLFSHYSGIWACDTEKGILENRVKISDIRPGFNDEFRPLVFLPDGRLILLGEAIDTNNDNESLKFLLLKYIPAGR